MYNSERLIEVLRKLGETLAKVEGLCNHTLSLSGDVILEFNENSGHIISHLKVNECPRIILEDVIIASMFMWIPNTFIMRKILFKILLKWFCCYPV